VKRSNPPRGKTERWIALSLAFLAMTRSHEPDGDAGMDKRSCSKKSCYIKITASYKTIFQSRRGHAQLFAFCALTEGKFSWEADMRINRLTSVAIIAATSFGTLAIGEARGPVRGKR
jgi:hypothetical protein